MREDKDEDFTVKTDVDGGLKPFAGVSDDGNANVAMVDSDRNLMVEVCLLLECSSGDEEHRPEFELVSF